MTKPAIHPAHCRCPHCNAPHPALSAPLTLRGLAVRFALLGLLAGLGRITIALLSTWSA